ncbi:hypothetical protein MBLNU230_g0948t1 [Neophaeotheca triangularis]
MERTEYPKLLASLQPSQAVDVLSERVREVGKLNTDLADWLQERRKLEEIYSTGLRKLSRKQLDGVDLGVFASPWNSLTTSCDELAEAHSALASKIEVDVERPLRNFASSNREMQAMSTVQGNLRAIAKDVDKAQERLDKQRAKGERPDTGRAATTHSDMENAQNQWQSQAPYVFENLQAVDEARLNHLRDVLTQFQTHEVDSVEKSRVTAESCLNILLNVETADEIKAFAIRASEGRPPPSREASAPMRYPNAGPSSSNVDLPGEEVSRQRSESAQQEKPEKEKKGAFKGLKRLGTVMGRKRESKMPSQLPAVSDSPERKQGRPSAFNSFSSRLGRNRDTQILEPPAESPASKRPSSPLRMGSEAMEPPQQSQEMPSPQARDVNERVNGTSTMHENMAPSTFAPIPSAGHQGDLADLDPPKASPPAAAAEPDNEGFSSPSQSLDPITQAQQEAAAAEGSQPQFNVNIRNAPIQEEGNDADTALQSMAQKLQMQAPPPTQRKLGTVRGRREARNSAYVSADQQSQISSTPPVASPSAEAPTSPPPVESSAIPEAPESPQADKSVQSPSLPSPDATPQIKGGSFPIPLTSGTPGADTQPHPTYRPMSPPKMLSSDNTGGDNQSIRSGRSLSSTTSQAARHPDLHETGLNTSIIETVSSRFENGQIASSSVIGEVALAYNAASFSTPFGTDTIRLDNFAGLDKVAPNPAFITQTPGKDGEYNVDLSSLSRTQVAFKYQVRVEDANAMAPLIITPAFRIEPTQTSVIVSYSLNPNLNLAGRETLTLSNVMLGITLEGARASSCQSKPVGTFAREKNLIFWQLGDVTLKPGAAPEKLLARFATDVEAKNGSVEAKWEIGGGDAHGLGSGLTISAQGQDSGAADGADPFADEDANGGGAAAWKNVQGVRKLVSGNYIAKR